MTPEELREKVGQFILASFYGNDCSPREFKECPSYRFQTEGKCACQDQTDEVIAMVLEEAAKVAEQEAFRLGLTPSPIAAAIRALAK